MCGASYGGDNQLWAATQRPAALRALAVELAADEGEHIAMLERLLEHTPSPIVDWASVYERDTA